MANVKFLEFFWNSLRPKNGGLKNIFGLQRTDLQTQKKFPNMDIF